MIKKKLVIALLNIIKTRYQLLRKGNDKLDFPSWKRIQLAKG